MPKGFSECQKSGGRIRTITLKGNRYMHICYKDGKSYAGEVKESKSEK